MEFEINGIMYKVGKLTAMKQFHILRRLAGAFAGIDFEANASAFLACGSNLEEEDWEYVIYSLLSVVMRKEEKGMGYAPICTGKSIAYVDIKEDLKVMVEIAIKSFQHNIGVENIGSFFQIPQESTEELKAQ